MIQIGKFIVSDLVGNLKSHFDMSTTCQKKCQTLGENLLLSKHSSFLLCSVLLLHWGVQKCRVKNVRMFFSWSSIGMPRMTILQRSMLQHDMIFLKIHNILVFLDMATTCLQHFQLMFLYVLSTVIETSFLELNSEVCNFLTMHYAAAWVFEHWFKNIFCYNKWSDCCVWLMQIILVHFF